MRTRDQIFRDLRRVEIKLEPENLYWDGERDPQEVKNEVQDLKTQKALLIKELGYTPSFRELFEL